MKIKYGLISCDSHAQLDKDTWTSRMSKERWGDKIPHLFETSDKKHMAVAYDHPVERWLVNGQVVGERGVVNCPTVMDDPMRKTFPQRWEEVPRKVYDPMTRLEALDGDGVDGEILFPNDPVQGATFFQGDDPEYELACVQAYNDAMAEWREASDRYVPLAIIPYLSGIEPAQLEVQRAVKKGHRGIVMLAEPSMSKKGLHHFNESYWDPLWAVCQDLDIPIHWHAGAGLRLSIPRWKGYSRNQEQAMGPAGGFSLQAQFIPNLIFSGVLDRYPRLKWVCAETGLGWVNYMLEGCDHEWERRHLWTEGIQTRPSELFKRQIHVDFWYETAGIGLRHKIGLDNIMWESDFPHSTSTFPESWKFVERTLKGVPQDERNQLLYGNAMRI
ncbi:MAG: amidohydrolase family protein, partial [Candidatus Entotheonellia bacterium]